MEMNILETLEQLGMTKGEATVYAALLELGPSSVGPILKRTTISHSNIYEILKRLQAKGIVTVIQKSNVKQFQAVSPGNLTNFLAKKQKKLDEQHTLLQQAIPHIEAIQHTHPKQEAQLFIGTRGLRAAYEELFRDADGEENLWIYVHDDSYAEMSDKFYMEQWFDVVKNVKSKGIADRSYKGSAYAKKFGKTYPLRYVDFPIFSHGEVCQDKFLMVSWEEPVITVLVHAKHVSEHFRKYFYDVWERATKK
ncbi:MAG: hypothetical protein OXR66_09080 [Candidatus Woesearchaeota archaeon]|nr:hypothetical protein [Candidatus Woesearchaeota archaeon]